MRKKVEKDRHAVGPILVLSYKNHALDEFLIDFINQYNFTYDQNSRFSNRYQRSYKTRLMNPGMLIRTGKPDIESLNIFTERFSPIERVAQDNLANVILVQRQTRILINSLWDCARNFESKAFFDVSILKYLFKLVEFK